MTAIEATPEDVRHAYRLLLGREPDEGGFASHVAMLAAAPRSTTDVARGFFASREFIERFGCLVEIPGGAQPPRGVGPLQCQACTRHQIESPAFLYWARRLGERPGGLHRKLWEWCFITQALYERSMLAKGRRGLGFAVGIEPLTALFASLGGNVLATDLDQAGADQAGWVESNQHANDRVDLNQKGLCPAVDFAERVTFENVDMRAIPTGLAGFDFLWSSCAMEHLGSLQSGLDFVVDAMRCLRPGGIAVHTTELNCDSDVDTFETGGSVVYRQRDLLGLGERLRALGHAVEPFDFHTGDTDADRHVDDEPYGRGPAHIKLRIGPYASTSFGLIVRKCGEEIR